MTHPTEPQGETPVRRYAVTKGFENDNGDFVKLADYRTLERALSECRRELAEAKDRLFRSVEFNAVTVAAPPAPSPAEGLAEDERAIVIAVLQEASKHEGYDGDPDGFFSDVCKTAMIALRSRQAPRGEGSVTKKLPPYPLKKALTVFFYEEDAEAIADADRCADAANGGTLTVRATRSEIFFHQLRLRCAQDPTLLDKIEVFVMRDDKLLPAGLRFEDELRWPVDFLQTCWRQEIEIQKARTQPAER